MPAWWLEKLRSKSKKKLATPSPRKKADVSTPAATEEIGGDGSLRLEEPVDLRKKEKAKSFDDGALRRRHPPPPPSANGVGVTASPPPAHPLPRPSEAISAAASTSVSSVSSTGSSADDTPDLVFCSGRYPEPLNTTRDRNLRSELDRVHNVAEDRHVVTCPPRMERSGCCGNPVSQKKEFHLHDFHVCNGTANSHCRSPIFKAGKVCSAPTLIGHPLQTSPVHTNVFNLCPESPTKRPDAIRSLRHRLPLPPSSPSSASSSSRSLKSEWKKGKLLGRGTFGNVYQGFNKESGQMCAIKEVTLISDDSNSRECLRQLSQEITLLSHLSHPNIVQYYGSELVDDTLSVYLEYVSGGSIHKLLQEYGPFGEPVIRSYTAQILSGLAYLHDRNTMHRDIKGANILVDPNGEIKLADFGMAKHMSSYTSIRSFKGSPYWMAPEVIMNCSGYSLSVDIWSLGCTVLEMATSKPPWSQFEGVAAIFKIGNSKDIPEIPDHLSPIGKDFVKQCLQRDPSARPAAAQLLDHPFVHDQAANKVSNSSLLTATLASTTESHETRTSEFSFRRRSISPLHNRVPEMRFATGLPTTYRSPSDLSDMRMNMSLPVSPCSSPLRQFKQSNWSCYPSPPHAAYSTGAMNYSPSNYTLYGATPGDRFQTTWLPPNIGVQSAYSSPRR